MHTHAITLSHTHIKATKGITDGVDTDGLDAAAREKARQNSLRQARMQQRMEAEAGDIITLNIALAGKAFFVNAPKVPIPEFLPKGSVRRLYEEPERKTRRKKK